MEEGGGRGREEKEGEREIEREREGERERGERTGQSGVDEPKEKRNIGTINKEA